MRVEEELGTYLQVLWRYKWMIAACAIIASTVALGISFQLTPLYTGTATMRVESAPINWSLLTRVTNTLVETATSYTNLDEVARQLGLEKPPKVEVEIVPETELITITASDPDPARARDIANTLASIMVEQSMEWYGNIRLTDRRKNLFTIIELASLPQRPATPRVPLNAALGLSAGLATGVILAFFFEGMDDTLRGIEDVEAITTLSIMGQIPERKRTLASVVDRIFSRRGRLLPMPGFHQLSARLLLSEDWPKSTSFLITSPEPRAGKSTVAANLAMSLAAAGHRVVLADMDFRRPCQHSIFDLPNGKGLSDYMCGKIQLDAALQHALYPSLRVATAGSSPDGISEWLAPVKIGALLERLGKDGDYVLIDAPAWLSVADPAMIASQADAVILVVARRGTGRKQLRFALQQLTELNARIAGIVVNRASHSRLYSYYQERSPKKAELIPSEEAQPQERADVRI
jgi:succinoglycan biosynthesis transport protein ExoP